MSTRSLGFPHTNTFVCRTAKPTSLLSVSSLQSFAFKARRNSMPPSFLGPYDDVHFTLMNHASVCGLHHHLVCQVINVYAPPQLNPLIVSVSVDPSFRSLLFPKTPAKSLLFIDDFNMELYAIHCPLASGFESLVPITLQNGSLLLNKGVSRSYIDPIYDHRSIQLRLAHALNRCFPIAWTDHSLLTFDLLLSCEGSGDWRFHLCSLDGWIPLYDSFTVPCTLSSRACMQNPLWCNLSGNPLKTHSTILGSRLQSKDKRALVDLQRKRSHLLSTAQRIEYKSVLYEVEGVEKCIDAERDLLLHIALCHSMVREKRIE